MIHQTSEIYKLPPPPPVHLQVQLSYCATRQVSVPR